MQFWQPTQAIWSKYGTDAGDAHSEISMDSDEDNAGFAAELSAPTAQVAVAHVAQLLPSGGADTAERCVAVESSTEGVREIGRAEGCAAGGSSKEGEEEIELADAATDAAQGDGWDANEVQVGGENGDERAEASHRGSKTSDEQVPGGGPGEDSAALCDVERPTGEEVAPDDRPRSAGCGDAGPYGMEVDADEAGGEDDEAVTELVAEVDPEGGEAEESTGEEGGQVRGDDSEGGARVEGREDEGKAEAGNGEEMRGDDAVSTEELGERDLELHQEGEGGARVEGREDEEEAEAGNGEEMRGDDAASTEELGERDLELHQEGEGGERDVEEDEDRDTNDIVQEAGEDEIDEAGEKGGSEEEGEAEMGPGGDTEEAGIQSQEVDERGAISEGGHDRMEEDASEY